MICEIFLQSVAHIITDPRFIYLFYFQVLFDQSSIPDFSILDPDFPVNLEVLLIKIILFFSTTEVISCSKIINTFKL